MCTWYQSWSLLSKSDIGFDTMRIAADVRFFVSLDLQAYQQETQQESPFPGCLLLHSAVSYSPTALLVSMVWIIFHIPGFAMRVSCSPRHSAAFCPLPEGFHAGAPPPLGSPVLTNRQR